MTGAQLPSSARVGLVTLRVADLERSIAFYENVIGFHLHWIGGHGDSRMAMLGVRGQQQALLELREKAGTRPVAPRGQIGLFHFAVLLPHRADLGRFIVHATNAGARFAAADHLFSEALYLTDPDGLQIEVYRDRPSEEWIFANGELVADTLRLDVDSVVASAAGTTWQGLPSGTSIGHIHLCVRDLEQARTFYVSALGFTPTVTSFPGALFVAAGDYHHHVGLNTWASGAPLASADEARLLWWHLVLPDDAAVDTAAERLRLAGYRAEPSLGGRGVVAYDPWDITVVLTT